MMQIDASEAMSQATDTVNDYTAEVAQNLDGLFGEGYAANNPVLVGLSVVAAAIDYHAWAILNIADAIKTHTNVVESHIGEIIDMGIASKEKRPVE